MTGRELYARFLRAATAPDGHDYYDDLSPYSQAAWDRLAAALDRDDNYLRERLVLNQRRLEAAIRTWLGYEDFSGTPESAVGVAAEMIEGTRRQEAAS